MPLFFFKPFALVVLFTTRKVNMETQEEQKRMLCHLHIDLDKEYELAHKRGKYNSISSYDMNILRYHGKRTLIYGAMVSHTQQILLLRVSLHFQTILHY